MRNLVLGLLAFLLAGTALLHRPLLGDEVLSSAAPFLGRGLFAGEFDDLERSGRLDDPSLDFAPWLHYAGRWFRETGTIPRWKSTATCGAPFIGNAQSAVFYPPNTAAILCGSPPRSFAFLALFKIVAAGLGAFLLARYHRLSMLGSLLCGATFAFGGFSVVYLRFPLTNVSCLFPWLVLAVEHAARRPSQRALAAVAVVAALQHLGGHPETTFHCQVAAFLYGAGVAWGTRRDRGPVVARTTWLAFAFSLGACLGAVQTAPFVEYLAASDVLRQRAAESAAATDGSVGLGAGFLVLIATAGWLAFRAARDGRIAAGVGAAILLGAAIATAHRVAVEWEPVVLLASDWFGGPADYRGTILYIAINNGFLGAALPLAIAGAILGVPRRAARTAAGAATLLFLLCAGAPVFSDILDHLPGFSLAVNSRLALPALLAMALLTGFGLDAIGRPAPRARVRLAIAWLVVALGMFLGLAIDTWLGHGQDTPIVRRLRAAAPVAAAVDEGLSNEASTSDTRTYVGWVALPAEPGHAMLLGGRSGAWPATLLQIPPTQRERVSELRQVDGTPYAFRVDIPMKELPAVDTPIRVLVTASDGSSYVSDLVGGPPVGRWLLHEIAPRGGSSRTQLLLLVAVSIASLIVLSARGRRGSIGRAVVTIFIIASQVLFVRPWLPTLPWSAYYPGSPIIERIRDAGSGGRFANIVSHQLPPEINAYYGVSDVLGYDAIYPRRVAEVLRQAYGAEDDRARIHHLRGRDRRDARLLGALGVRYALSGRDLPDFGDTVQRRGHTRVVENRWFLSRARVVPSSAVVPDDMEVLRGLDRDDLDLARTVLLSDGELIDLPLGSSSVEFLVDEPDRVELSVRSEHGGYLVLADTWFPGWTAEVDGERREIVRANHAFRAVRIDVGEHRIRFTYAPRSLRLGAWLSAIAAIGVAVLLLRRRGRRSSS